MRKKDKKIEIHIEENRITLDGEIFPSQQLLIGKKEIGSIVEIDSQFAVVKKGKTTALYKKFDDAVQSIIENYNLHK